MFVHLGRFGVRYHRSVLLASALVLVVGIGLGSQVFGQLKESNGSSRAESVRGFQLLEEASRQARGCWPWWTARRSTTRRPAVPSPP